MSLYYRKFCFQNEELNCSQNTCTTLRLKVCLDKTFFLLMEEISIAGCPSLSSPATPKISSILFLVVNRNPINREMEACSQKGNIWETAPPSICRNFCWIYFMLYPACATFKSLTYILNNINAQSPWFIFTFFYRLNKVFCFFNKSVRDFQYSYQQLSFRK